MEKIIIFLLLLINSFLLSLNSPIYIKNKTEKIKIQPIEVKNKKERNEVWIKLIEIDRNKINIKNYKNNDWEYKYDALVNYKNNKSLELKINYFESYNICFLKHPQSKKINLITEKQGSLIDLYNDKFDLSCIYKTAYPKGKPLSILMFFYFISFLIYFLIQIIFIFLSKKIFINKINIDITKNSKEFFFIVFVSSLIFFMSFLLIYWPGIYSIDSFDIINQANYFKIRDNHPALYTFFNALILIAFKKSVFLIIFQIIFVSFTIAFIFSFFKKISWLYLTLLIVNPVNLFMIITFWKDIPYSFALLGLTFILFLFFNEKNETFFKNKLIIFLYFLFSFIIIFSRHNGILTLLFFNIFLILIFITLKNKKIIQLTKYFLIIVVFFILIKKFIYPIFLYSKNSFNYEVPKKNVLNIFKPHIFYFSKKYIQEINVNDKYYHYFNQIYPIKKLPKINGYPFYADILFREKEFNYKLLMENDLIFSFIKERVLKKPNYFLDNLLKNYSLIWKIEPYPNSYTYIPTDELNFLKKENCKDPRSYDYCKYITRSKLPVLKKYTDEFIKDVNKNFFIIWRPATYLLISNLLAVFLLFLTKNISLVIPLLSIYSNIFPYFTILLPQDFRYFYINVLILNFYLFIFLKNLRK
jgi:hypothetical protein